MCAYKLIKPSDDYIKEIDNFKKEILSSDTEYKFAGCASLENFDDIKEWIKKVDSYSSKETCPSGFVPSSLFMFVRDVDNKVVGMIDLRHHIDHPILSLFGGHIGYSIRPSERRKGIGTLMLKEALSKYKELNVNRVLVTCFKDNIGSEMVILNNGGVFEKEVEHEGAKYKRFWIDIN